MLIVRKTQARRENQDSSIESQGTALQTLRQQLKIIEDAAKSDDLMEMRDAILMSLSNMVIVPMPGFFINGFPHSAYDF